MRTLASVLLAIVLAFFVCVTPAVSAVILYVDDDADTNATPCDEGTGTLADPYECIQSAIDASVSGDEIIVRDGAYVGAGNKNLDFAGKAIILRSENGPEHCVIDCGGSGRGFYFHNGEASDSVVDGFTITNALITYTGNFPDGWGAGIFCLSSSPSIANCVITGNKSIGTDSGSGAGISCYSTASPSITNCTITGNSGVWGGGVYCNFSSSPNIINCTVSGNTAQGGGGIYTANSSWPNIVNSILWDNSATYGPEMDIVQDSDLTVSYSDVDGGLAGAYVQPSSAVHWGSGNRNQTPLFVSPGYWIGDNWVGGDYHLTAASPCIDAGTNAGVSTDIDGEARPNGGFDIGSDEYYVATAPRISMTPVLMLNSCEEGADAPAKGFYVWNSGIGTVSYSISDDADWMYCWPSSGDSTGEQDIITVIFDTSGLGVGTHSATITIADAGAENSPQYVDVSLTVTTPELTRIALLSPTNQSTLTSPPTFSWEPNGGEVVAFAVDASLSPTFSRYWSTYDNLGLYIYPTGWTMPAWIWDMIPSGSPIYWRVRGVDWMHSPMTVITSDARSFFKQ